MEKQDIFTGSRVDVSFTMNTQNETASFFDPDYTDIKNLAAFPTLTSKTAISEIETYDDDMTSKLSGDISLEPTKLSMSYVINDPVQTTLIQAAKDKTPVRFKNFYIIDTGENKSSSQTGYYQIYDAFVSGHEIVNAGSIATLNLNIAPTNGILSEGVAQIGEVMRKGDYGVGAGVEGYEGVKDSSSLTGNRWVTMDAANSDNPFGSDTSMMAIQYSEKQGWQLIGTSTGKPLLRLRNIQDKGKVTKSKWVKVYTDEEKPTNDDLNLVSRAGDTMTGRLTLPTIDVKNIDTAITWGNAGAKTANTGDIWGKVFGSFVDKPEGAWLSEALKVIAKNAQTETNKKVSKSGDTMTGQLIVPSEMGLRTASSPHEEESFYTTISNINDTSTLIRVSDIEDGPIHYIGINKSGHALVNENGLISRIYHQNFKPTPLEIKAVALSEVLDAGEF